MSRMTVWCGAALVAVCAVGPALAQAPATQRVKGVIEKVDGNKVVVKMPNGAEATVVLAANAQVIDVHKATIADIKENSYIGSGAVPQADGTQKAVEVHIFAESQRGTGDGHRPGWPGAPNGTMTNGAVAGNVVASVDGPVVTIKYNGGEKKVIVGPNVPIVKYQVGTSADLKPGAAMSIPAATKNADGTLASNRINVGVDGAVPN
jgi:hypothetical protein